MKVFWSRCGHGHGNFGDKLTPLFLDYLKIQYRWVSAEDAELIGIGSLIEKVPDNFKGVVWSTGSMFENSRKDLTGADVLGVRGKLTREQIEHPNKKSIAIGDAGLLAHLFHEPTKKRFKMGIIPHFVDHESPIIAKLAESSSDITLIDICAPTLDVIQHVGECESILSTSLHALVLADSLGIPNRWIEVGANTVSGEGFKFRDYYSNFNLPEMRPVQLTGQETMAILLSLISDYSRPNIAQVKAELMKSLERLARRFGGNFQQPRTLSELSLREKLAAREREAWNNQIRCSLESLEEFVPASCRFVLIDDEQLRGEILHAIPIPLIERNGEYWGAPESEEHAVAELERHLASGIEYVVVAACSFWWLDSYPGFADYLSKNLICRCTTPYIRVFQRKPATKR